MTMECHVEYEIMASHLVERADGLNATRVIDMIRVTGVTRPHLCDEKDSAPSVCREPFFPLSQSEPCAEVVF